MHCPFLKTYGKYSWNFWSNLTWSNLQAFFILCLFYFPKGSGIPLSELVFLMTSCQWKEGGQMLASWVSPGQAFALCWAESCLFYDTFFLFLDHRIFSTMASLNISTIQTTAKPLIQNVSSPETFYDQNHLLLTSLGDKYQEEVLPFSKFTRTGHE